MAGPLRRFIVVLALILSDLDSIDCQTRGAHRRSTEFRAHIPTRQWSISANEPLLAVKSPLRVTQVGLAERLRLPGWTEFNAISPWM
jgi:hypothetical protein